MFLVSEPNQIISTAKRQNENHKLQHKERYSSNISVFVDALVAFKASEI